MLPISHVLCLVSSQPIFISDSIQIRVTMSSFCRHHGILILFTATPSTSLYFLKKVVKFLLNVLSFTFTKWYLFPPPLLLLFTPTYAVRYVYKALPIICTRELLPLETVYVQLHLNSMGGKNMMTCLTVWTKI